MDADLTLYHSPQTRSTGVRILLEELGVPHRLDVRDLRSGQGRDSAYLRVNPLGKVPALRHGDALITEQAAIYLYLADLFPERGLAPPIGDPLRGPYLRWMVFYGSSFEPAVVDRALQREPGPKAMSPYGDFDAVLKTVVDALTPGPYLLGARHSAADVLWGSALNWTTSFKLVPEEPAIMAYLARINARPAVGTILAAEAALSAELEAARG
ncbi:glutathione S-transferase [Methylobacterium sp. Leaf104]|uniref:glutathione S-transferase family protein n=1 Tax=Methylobacterium TaxID=407 RepID=UPI0006F23C38|nr:MULTISPECIES: glutathione S-transferase family protein [Methylobacterium]KQP33568.1 glutathione S-transferase [Methylobacterium sp. Leaf104]MCI9879903.1 glutathione S-transferase family protein [Methylobacterium goesingense]